MEGDKEDRDERRTDTPKFPRLWVDDERNNFTEYDLKVQHALSDMELLDVVLNPAPIKPRLIPEKEI